MAPETQNKTVYAEDTKESVGFLLRLRFPWLLVGLVGGALATLLVSKFEAVLSRNISLAFFLPMIVYMSDAVGTQTETIYVRNLAKGRVNVFVYLIKEFFLGIFLGLVFGLLIGLFALIWLSSGRTAFTIGLSMFITVAIAPLVALVIPLILYKEHTDPALGAGPFSTIIQDITSLLIYFLIASLILFQ